MDWKKRKINVAIQVLPEAEGQLKYELVDKAIEAIKEIGYNYTVCPFETVVECTFEELSGLLEEVHESCNRAGAGHMITNLKIQVDFYKSIKIDDKMEKYR